MSALVSCPVCEVRIDAGLAAAGSEVACPCCRALIAVPVAVASVAVVVACAVCGVALSGLRPGEQGACPSCRALVVAPTGASAATAAPPCAAAPSAGTTGGRGGAVSALVLGILGMIPGIGLVAAVLGAVGVRRARAGGAGGGLALAGLILGACWTLVHVITVPLAISSIADHHRHVRLARVAAVAEAVAGGLRGRPTWLPHAQNAGPHSHGWITGPNLRLGDLDTTGLRIVPPGVTGADGLVACEDRSDGGRAAAWIDGASGAVRTGWLEDEALAALLPWLDPDRQIAAAVAAEGRHEFPLALRHRRSALVLDPYPHRRLPGLVRLAVAGGLQDEVAWLVDELDSGGPDPFVAQATALRAAAAGDRGPARSLTAPGAHRPDLAPDLAIDLDLGLADLNQALGDGAAALAAYEGFLAAAPDAHPERPRVSAALGDIAEDGFTWPASLADYLVPDLARLAPTVWDAELEPEQRLRNAARCLDLAERWALLRDRQRLALAPRLHAWAALALASACTQMRAYPQALALLDEAEVASASPAVPIEPAPATAAEDDAPAGPPPVTASDEAYADAAPECARLRDLLRELGALRPAHAESVAVPDGTVAAYVYDTADAADDEEPIGERLWVVSDADRRCVATYAITAYPERGAARSRVLSRHALAEDEVLQVLAAGTSAAEAQGLVLADVARRRARPAGSLAQAKEAISGAGWLFFRLSGSLDDLGVHPPTDASP